MSDVTVVADRRARRAQLVTIAVFVVGIALRVVLAFVVYRGRGFAGDLRDFASWATTAAAKGPGEFYRNSPTANYPPGYLWVLWALGGASRPIAAITGATRAGTLLALLKLPAVLADVAIAAVVLRAGRRWYGGDAGRWAAALYLLVPITWVDSSLWGQVDAVAALVMLLAVVALVDGHSERAAGFAVLAVLVKPQAFVVLAVVGAVLVRRHVLGRPRRRAVSSVIVAAVVGVLVVVPFHTRTLTATHWRRVPVLGDAVGLAALIKSTGRQYSVLTANAYNVWSLAGRAPLARTISSGRVRWILDSTHVLGAPAVAIGGALLAIVGLVVVAGLLRRDDRTAVLLGFTVLAYAFYALPTRVHERYLFPVFAVGVLLAVHPARRVAYVLAAVVNTVNLWAVLAAPLAFGGAPRGGPGLPGNRSGVPQDVRLPGVGFARDHVTVWVVVSLQTAAMIALLAVWCVTVGRGSWTANRPPTTDD